MTIQCLSEKLIVDYYSQNILLDVDSLVFIEEYLQRLRVYDDYDN